MKGKIDNPDKMQIFISEFMLKDIGSSAYTEYEFGGEMIDLFDAKPHLLEPGVKMGHLHTHHQMNTFFSGTDMRCLHDNAPLFDMFLSVIVNTAGKRIAKIAVITKIQRKVSYTMVRRLLSFRTKPEECLGLIDCEVLIENDNAIIQEVTTLITEKEKAKKEAREKTREANKFNKSFNSKNFTDDVGISISPQLNLFSDQERLDMIEELKLRGSEIDNEELLHAEAIENMVVRSISVDDLATSDLKDAIPLINRKLPKEDYTLELSTMMGHFFNTLQSEYYYDQFGYVVERTMELLDDFSGRYKFIDGIIYSLKCWINEFGDFDELSNGSYELDDPAADDILQSRRNGNGREIIKYPETKGTNEF